MKPTNRKGEPMTNEDGHEPCCLCGKQIDGYGNNAAPVEEGRCCDLCNVTIVIPARMIILFPQSAGRAGF